jgi:outer membrane lipoprotein-sorting protein
MKKIILLFIIIQVLGTVTSIAQTSENAMKLLDEVTQTISNYENFTFDFSYVLENRQENIRQETNGFITVSKNKYKLNYLGAEQLFDGQKTYTIVSENQEITISTPEEGEDFGINPSKLLNFYKSGYDYQWDIKQSVLERPIQFIKLIPSEEKQDVKYLLLGIDLVKKSIYRLIEIGSNGTRTTLTLSNESINNVLKDDFFTFNASKYPNFYINK